jgi:hypothetical protein
MTLFCRLIRRHYWCTPHRSADNRLVQVCYECGAERLVRELHDEIFTERVNHSLAAAKSSLASLAMQHMEQEPQQRMINGTRIAVGQQVHARKFTLVK